MAKYFDSKKEAIEVRDKYNHNFNCDGYSATLQAKRVELVYHHSALERGYITKNGGRDDYYDGKYGVGFKRHRPNCETLRCLRSSYFHVVWYYVEKKA